MGLFPYDKAIENGTKLLTRVSDLVDDWGFTKEERAENELKRAEDYHKFMQLTDTVAQQIRSQTRAKLVKFVVYPYVSGWIATFPVMLISVFYEPFQVLLDLLIAWLKMFTPIVAAFGGAYLGYYGIQSIMGTLKNGQNKK